MIGKIRVLEGLKVRKEEAALRHLQGRRRALADAETALADAIELEAASAETLPDREDAIYRTIMNILVKQDDIDSMKGRLAALARSHQNLVDDVTRLRQTVSTRRTEVAEAIERHVIARRVREKYVILRERMVAELHAAEEAREEVEVEDLFAVPRGAAVQGGAHVD